MKRQHAFPARPERLPVFPVPTARVERYRTDPGYGTRGGFASGFRTPDNYAYRDPEQPPDSLWNDVRACAIAVAVLLVLTFLASWLP